jgi:hypothetical protein
MRGLTKVNGNSEQRARVSDELRQLKQMSKGLRTQAMRSLMERHAAQRLEVKPVALPPTKVGGSVAA